MRQRQSVAQSINDLSQKTKIELCSASILTKDALKIFCMNYFCKYVRNYFCVVENEPTFIKYFFKAGPLENIIRKEDRNGNLICLIIYKHIESCDYAIKLFNGITLFNTSLKVQQSQTGGQGPQQKRPAPAQNNYANVNDRNERNDRDRNRMDRRMSYEPQNMSPPSPSTPLMRPPQQSLTNLMAQQFSQVAEFGTRGSNQFMNPYSDIINRSVSGPNLNYDNNQNDYQNQHHSRRSFNNNNMNQGGRNNSRGYSNDNRSDHRRSQDAGFNQNNQQQNNFQRNRSQHGDKNERNDDRSRSPIRKRNRY